MKRSMFSRPNADFVRTLLATLLAEIYGPDPETRRAVTHKFDIAGHEGYLTVGLFEDGQPGEIGVYRPAPRRNTLVFTFDANGDGEVTIDELLSAVAAALEPQLAREEP